RASLTHFAFQLVQTLRFADYAKALGVNEAIYQLAALDRAIFIENKHRHVLHVVVERIAERDHLDQRREKEKKQSQRIAPDDDELLEQNCGKPSKRFVFHVALLVIPSEARDLAYVAKALVINPPTSDSFFRAVHFSSRVASL